MYWTSTLYVLVYKDLAERVNIVRGRFAAIDRFDSIACTFVFICITYSLSLTMSSLFAQHLLVLVVIVAVVATAAEETPAGALTPVRLSLQITYWAVPPYVAQRLGYFQELGLNVSFVTYPSGAPQVNQSSEWDIGATGSVPAILAAAASGTNSITTIGISNDESEVNALVGPLDEEWPPAALDNATVISVTPASTGQLAVEECLVQAGFTNLSALAFEYRQPSEVLQALEDGTAKYGGLWPPMLYTYLGGGGNVDAADNRAVLCTGKDAGVVIPGSIVVRDDWAEANPQVVAKVLAAWLRGIEYVQDIDKRAEVLSYMDDFYGENGLSVSLKDMERDIITRPLFGLEDQIAILSGEAPNWYDRIAEFMKSSGLIDDVPSTDSYLTSKYMEMVSEDDTLREFASGGGVPAPTSAPAAGSSDGRIDTRAGLTSVLLLGASFLATLTS